MFTEHLSNSRMLILVNAEFDIICVYSFVGFADGGFSIIR